MFSQSLCQLPPPPQPGNNEDLNDQNLRQEQQARPQAAAAFFSPPSYKEPPCQTHYQKQVKLSAQIKDNPALFVASADSHDHEEFEGGLVAAVNMINGMASARFQRGSSPASTPPPVASQPPSQQQMPPRSLPILAETSMLSWLPENPGATVSTQQHQQSPPIEQLCGKEASVASATLSAQPFPSATIRVVSVTPPAITHESHHFPMQQHHRSRTASTGLQLRTDVPSHARYAAQTFEASVPAVHISPTRIQSPVAVGARPLHFVDLVAIENDPNVPPSVTLPSPSSTTASISVNKPQLSDLPPRSKSTPHGENPYRHNHHAHFQLPRTSLPLPPPKSPSVDATSISSIRSHGSGGTTQKKRFGAFKVPPPTSIQTERTRSAASTPARRSLYSETRTSQQMQARTVVAAASVITSRSTLAVVSIAAPVMLHNEPTCKSRVLLPFTAPKEPSRSPVSFQQQLAPENQHPVRVAYTHLIETETLPLHPEDRKSKKQLPRTEKELAAVVSAVESSRLANGCLQLMDNNSIRTQYDDAEGNRCFWNRPHNIDYAVTGIEKEEEGTSGEEKIHSVVVPALVLKNNQIDTSFLPKVDDLDENEEAQQMQSTLAGADSARTMTGAGDTPHGDVLFDGWEEVVDSSSGKTHYHNEIDGTTTWDRPAVFLLAAAPENHVQMVTMAHELGVHLHKLPELSTEAPEEATAHAKPLIEKDSRDNLEVASDPIIRPKDDENEYDGNRAVNDDHLSREYFKFEPKEVISDNLKGLAATVENVNFACAKCDPEVDVEVSCTCAIEPLFTSDHITEHKKQEQVRLPLEPVELTPPFLSNQYVFNESENIVTVKRPLANVIDEEPVYSTEEKYLCISRGEVNANVSGKDTTRDNVLAGVLDERLGEAKSGDEQRFNGEVESEILDAINENSDFVDHTNNSGKKVSPFPAGWVELIDRASDTSYNFNESDNATSWDRSLLMLQEDATNRKKPPVLLPAHCVAREQNADEWMERTEEESDEIVLDDDAQFPDGKAILKVATASEPNQIKNVPEFKISKQKLRNGFDELSAGKEVSNNVSSLPPGWMELSDALSGSPYYLNEVDNVTVRDRPTLDVPENEVTNNGKIPRPAAVDVKSSVKELDVGEEANKALKDFTAAKAPSNGEEVKALTMLSLPSGWLELLDVESGKAYYFHEAYNTTTWERPIAEDEMTDGNGSRSVVESDITLRTGSSGEFDEVAAITDVVESFEQSGVCCERYTKETASSTNEVNEAANTVTKLNTLAITLLPGWIELIDPSSGVPYYLRELDGITTWERHDSGLEESATADDNPAEGLKPYVNEITDLRYNQTGNIVSRAIVDSEGTVITGRKPEESDSIILGCEEETVEMVSCNQVASVEGESPGVLKTVPSPAYGDIKTQEIDAEAVDVYTASIEELATVGDCESKGAVLLGNIVTADKGEGTKIKAVLPMVWKEQILTACGKRNCRYDVDYTTTRERPATMSKSSESTDLLREAIVIVEGVSDEPGTQDEVADVLICEDMGNGSSKMNEDGPVTEEIKAGDNFEIPDTATLLPQGWIELLDPSSGNPYYLNETDDATTWKRPTAVSGDIISDPIVPKCIAGPFVELAEKCAQETTENAVQTTTENKINLVPQMREKTVTDPLVGWFELVDETSGKHYYFNELENRTTQDPCILGTVEKSSGLPKRAVSPDKFLERRRPKHAFATFAFGGKLCICRPYEPFVIKNSVFVHRVCNVVPLDVISIVERIKQENGLTGALNANNETAVMSHIEHKARRENKGELLWQLVRIAANSKGRFRSDDGLSNPDGPEAAIVKLLLQNEDGCTIQEKMTKCDVSKIHEEQNHDGNVDISSSLDNIQDLLLRGKRGEAVQEAIADKNFTMALLISCMCDRGTFQKTAREFANEVLLLGSPLHTLAMLFSGQLEPPDDSAFDGTGAKSPLWGGSPEQLVAMWRFHLAAIISNRILGWDRVVLALGDRLWESGRVYAAHFCYMVCGCPVTSPLNSSTRIALVGCDHLLPMNTTVMTGESIDAYQRTEAYEWAKRRGNPQAAIQPLQPFKLKYAMLLADLGFPGEASDYLESIRLSIGPVEKDTKATEPAVPSTFASLLTHCDAFLGALREFENRLSCRDCAQVYANAQSYPRNKGDKKVLPQSNIQIRTSEAKVLLKKTGGVVPVISQNDSNKYAAFPTFPSLNILPVRQPVEPVRTLDDDDDDTFVSARTAITSVSLREESTGSNKLAPKAMFFNASQLKRNAPRVPTAKALRVVSSTMNTTRTAASKDPLVIPGTPPSNKKMAVSLCVPVVKRTDPLKSPSRMSGIRDNPVLVGDLLSMPNTTNRSRPSQTDGLHKTATSKRDMPIGERIVIQPAPLSAPIPSLKSKLHDKNPNQNIAIHVGCAHKNSRLFVNMRFTDSVSSPRSGAWGLGIGDWVTKKLNPDATKADLGRGMQAYFDEKKGWIFPGEDPVEELKSIAPPPTILNAALTEKKAYLNDPLSIMMAPPNHIPAALQGRSTRGRDAVLSMKLRGYPGMQNPMCPKLGVVDSDVFVTCSSLPASVAAPPQFAVFQPKLVDVLRKEELNKE